MPYKMFFIIFAFLPIFSQAENVYIFPDLYKGKVELCAPDMTKVKELIESTRDTYYGDEGRDSFVKGVDINGNGDCEVIMESAPIYQGNSGGGSYYLYAFKNGKYSSIGFLRQGYWLGEAHNGYPRILYQVNIGSKPSPVWITVVTSFNGEEYAEEFRSSMSYGEYLNKGLAAFRAKDYEAAQLWYLSAYRLNAERNLSDANNLAIVYIRQGHCDKAKELLGSHLNKPIRSLDEKYVKAARFNLGLCK